MLKFQIFPSKEDSSINYVADLSSEGMIECRYVKRPSKNHHNIYLSAQTYCAQGCLFCHLTDTKQNKGREITTEEIADQAEVVMRGLLLEKMKTGNWPSPLLNSKRTRNFIIFNDEIHFLFMARGDVLASTVPYRWKEICEAIDERVIRCGFDPEKVIFKISTIFPKCFRETFVDNNQDDLIAMDELLVHCFKQDIKQRHWPIFYYSLYSADQTWLDKWMPNAECIKTALETFKEWQRVTGMKVGLHFSPLANGTFAPHTLKTVATKVKQSKLEPFWNLVYFNAPSSFTNPFYHNNQDDMMEHFTKKIREWFPNAQVQIQPRVGKDVAASCGMFGYSKDNKIHLPVLK